uniref:Uncharacterized protein n=1 Tax=Nelumbo nucifera TaxID=4432 RepID=A0A822ZX39_NELNU|nr:TPA_asm: hypothetical protein HUJ06_018997 [Nelumbo nucifera]
MVRDWEGLDASSPALLSYGFGLTNALRFRAGPN